jgi:hypothetical protein
MVYLARKGDEVVHHTSLDALKELDGIDEPEMEISDEEFEAAENLARIIKGKIFIGKTDEEKKRDEAAQEIEALQAKIDETDYIGIKIAEGVATKNDYADMIAQREEWRKAKRELTKKIGVAG